MDILALANRCEQQQAVQLVTQQLAQQQRITRAPEFFGDVRVSTLLRASNRHMRHTPGDGHNNCGFNTILEQVGDRTSSPEMVNALRYRLSYGDESSNQEFSTGSFSAVANLFNCPVVCIYHRDNKIKKLSFSIPVLDGMRFKFRRNMQLSENFAQYLRNFGLSREMADILSQWLAANVPSIGVDFNAATLYDIALQLLRWPTTIAFVTIYTGGHFDAAPHRDLQPGANVLPFLRGEEEDY
ncbi:MAG: hypothetical protein LBS22_00360 [Puniceicoccales bacterium]|jgi:hypothetical protein|nr:hypothetical protein [Puniceicoccales bacterium]